MPQLLKRTILLLAAVTFLIGLYLFADDYLYTGIRPVEIDHAKFQASYYSNNTGSKRPAVVIVGGGNWGDFWGNELAQNNYIGLSLPYCCQGDLPGLVEDIPLEYFQYAVQWLSDQKEVDPQKIIVMGASRNAEAALLVAAYFPEHIHGAIAYNPSSVSWSNTVMPRHSATTTSSWSYNGKSIPFLAMEEFKPEGDSPLETLQYWLEGLSDSIGIIQAGIPVEKINGPVLLLSGKEDEVWPSSIMSNQIEKRALESNFDYELENIQFENAGHQLSAHPYFPAEQRTGEMLLHGKKHTYSFGGTIEGDALGQKEALKKVLEYMNRLDKSKG